MCQQTIFVYQGDLANPKNSYNKMFKGEKNEPANDKIKSNRQDAKVAYYKEGAKSRKNFLLVLPFLW